jgi:hypothetical protein
LIKLQAPTTHDAVTHGNIRNISYMMHEIMLPKADVGLTIEFFPEGLQDQKILLLLDYERIPTYKKYQYAAIAGDGTRTTVWNMKGGKSLDYLYFLHSLL